MLKKLVFSFLLVVATCSYVYAEWLVDFRDIYLEDGIDAAVIEALRQGAQPDEIMYNGLEQEGINPQNLVKAMYCGGVKGDDIKTAADEYGVSEMLLVAGYKKSVEECGDAVTDTQAYTPAGTPAAAVSFVGASAPGGGSYASPSTL